MPQTWGIGADLRGPLHLDYPGSLNEILYLSFHVPVISKPCVEEEVWTCSAIILATGWWVRQKSRFARGSPCWTPIMQWRSLSPKLRTPLHPYKDNPVRDFREELPHLLKHLESAYGIVSIVKVCLKDTSPSSRYLGGWRHEERPGSMDDSFTTTWSPDHLLAFY